MPWSSTPVANLKGPPGAGINFVGDTPNPPTGNLLPPGVPGAGQPAQPGDAVITDDDHIWIFTEEGAWVDLGNLAVEVGSGSGTSILTIPFTWSSSTVEADPGSGFIRGEQADLGLTTEFDFFISTLDKNGTQFAALTAMYNDDFIYLVKAGNNKLYNRYRVIRPPFQNGTPPTWSYISVRYDPPSWYSTPAWAPVNGEEVVLLLMPYPHNIDTNGEWGQVLTSEGGYETQWNFLGKIHTGDGLSSAVEPGFDLLSGDVYLNVLAAPFPNDGIIVGADTVGIDPTVIQKRSEKGVASGYAPLGADNLVPAVHLPASGGGGTLSLDIQVFDTPGVHTWTKPANAVRTEIQAVGTGGGGGSGRRGAVGTLRAGGAAGGGGGYLEHTLDASAMPDVLDITVGAGGVPGAARTANDTNGSPGAQGGPTYVEYGGAMWIYQSGGGGGIGGTAIGGSTGGSAGGGHYLGTDGADSSDTGGAGPAGVHAGIRSPSARATGGGAGGGITTNNAASVGGMAGMTIARGTQIAGGTIALPNGQSDTNKMPGAWFDTMGGGGGASSITGSGGNGGSGIAGSGGGGGGASVNDVGNSGAGGKGGDACVVITTWCVP